MKNLFNIIRFVWMIFYARLLDWWESTFSSHWSAAGNLPPPSLRYRVSGTTDRHFYLWYGKLVWDVISEKIENHHIFSDKARDNKLLEYGCGCGLMARHIDPERINYTGTHPDWDAYDWCDYNLGVDKNFRFVKTDHPVLSIPRSQSVIVAVDVFTRISFEEQGELLRKFHGLLEIGGKVILTVHGEKAATKALSRDDLAEYEANMYFYKESRYMKRYFSSAFHSKWYVTRKWVDTGFQVIEYDEGGLNGWQDVVVLRKL